ncbi:hypothetical protein P152DRAFT_395615 [Eremomyces bilateralis CBS 781.70]|uniref:Uncharacterized protein n=1 Tax=Eremomyces bilateralis CBS 781.70 TaxID=1392243 RepID=A0A6G1G5M3_9PEZI|nr:uncharacterized protein P152DRAFT_395615 [Eremomyces bilateralis CBS 781.70]KAF1813395.1 hypothetical protein P152DRAFT_395615 [Eremomyces bilateralis CBS 781.70]
MQCLRASRPIGAFRSIQPQRALSTLPNNPHIYTFPDPPTSGHLLTLLPTDPPTRSLAIGFSPSIPPSPSTFRENPTFLRLLHAVIRTHAIHDPRIQSQAQVFAGPGGSSFGFGGSTTLPSNHPANRSRRTAEPRSPGIKAGGDGAGGASRQGGAGGGKMGGWIHVSDERKPPDWGRIAWPEDIFGSLQVDGEGRFVGEGGEYQESGTYRVVTNEGVLGLSPFLRECLVRELRALEKCGKI